MHEVSRRKEMRIRLDGVGGSVYRGAHRSLVGFAVGRLRGCCGFIFVYPRHHPSFSGTTKGENKPVDLPRSQKPILRLLRSPLRGATRAT